MDRLRMVFQRIRHAGLKLAPKKCRFFKEKVVCVGHMVSRDDTEPDPDKKETIKNWPTPSSPEYVRRF